MPRPAGRAAPGAPPCGRRHLAAIRLRLGRRPRALAPPVVTSAPNRPHRVAYSGDRSRLRPQVEMVDGVHRLQENLDSRGNQVARAVPCVKKGTEMKIAPYQYRGAGPTFSSRYLMVPVLAMLPPLDEHTRVLDVGCGKGFWATQLTPFGCSIVGVDPSESGIAIARETTPAARFECMPMVQDLCETLSEEPFDLVLSLEVVEHLYSPREWAASCFAALRLGGTLICSTPYHGYLKNLAICLANRFDRHVQPLRDGGHIKFFSRNTLEQLLHQAGFRDTYFTGAGRARWFWSSMVMSARRPE